jgi:hypothetical protein
MLGWRPFLLSGLAALLIAVAVLDADTAGRKSAPAPCASANKLRDGGLIAAARKGYVTVLRSDPKSMCALAGLEDVITQDCARLKSLAKADPATARKLLLADAKADPPPAAKSCVWTDLAALPAKGS